MPTFSITINGLDELNRKLQLLVQRAPAEAGKTLYREATKIMAASKELVPVATGALRASGYVALPVVAGSRVSVTMGYGGAAGGNEKDGGKVGYALPVHENLTARHPVGRSKYLEAAVLEAIPGLNQAIAADYVEIFKGTA